MRKHKFLVYSVVWLLIIALSFYLQLTEIKNDAKTMAANQVDQYIKSIDLLRQWHSLHPIDSATAADSSRQATATIPYFQSADPAENNRNPSPNQCLARQLAQTASSHSGIEFHLTGFKPLRPENKPDNWELTSLMGFINGEIRHNAIFSDEGQTFYRYMQPWQADHSCIQCHSAQGLRAGSGYGAISVSIPAGTIREQVTSRLQQQLLAHVLIALAGLAVILVFFLAHKKMQYRLSKAKRQLKLAYLDVLTQLPNRRYYDFFVSKEWKQAMRQGYPLSMIMIDIDFFKLYNDKLGHPMGDQCLQQVAKTLKLYSRRAGDLIARYGGEEFCVVAACDAEQIRQLAEILRKAVEYMELPHPGSKVSSFVTISQGTATVIPDESMEFEELLRHADQSLYKAKENGRNRVESYIGGNVAARQSRNNHRQPAETQP